MRNRVPLLLALALLASCRAVAPAPAPGPGVAQRGAEVLRPYKQELQAALQEGLARGPTEAIDACRVRAPEIARAASTGGAVVGRTSHRLRNPDNAPREWVKPLLEAYLAEPSDRAPRTVALGDRRHGYVEPIVVQPPCLTCHGDAIAEPLRRRIAALYPEDRATGFQVGELRGLFWVELDPEQR